MLIHLNARDGDLHCKKFNICPTQNVLVTGNIKHFPLAQFLHIEIRQIDLFRLWQQLVDIGSMINNVLSQLEKH